MNELIQSIFNNFIVDGVPVPVAFLRYKGKSTTYVTYMETDINITLFQCIAKFLHTYSSLSSS